MACTKIATACAPMPYVAWWNLSSALKRAGLPLPPRSFSSAPARAPSAMLLLPLSFNSIAFCAPRSMPATVLANAAIPAVAVAGVSDAARGAAGVAASDVAASSVDSPAVLRALVSTDMPSSPALVCASLLDWACASRVAASSPCSCRQCGVFGQCSVPSSLQEGVAAIGCSDGRVQAQGRGRGRLCILVINTARFVQIVVAAVSWGSLGTPLRECRAGVRTA